MKIDKILSQSRRDFWADYVCEHCGCMDRNVKGYDDAYFHEHIIPDMICPECGEKAPPDYRPLTTKYPEGFQV